MTNESKPSNEGPSTESRIHLRVGWWALLAYLTLGVALESMHGFKAWFYLDVSYETRRLMWTLSHAHGTLLGIVNIVFALSVDRLHGWSPLMRRIASRCLLGATLLLPLGFFLGGVVFYSGDPGPGILLVPLGAALLILSVFLTARASGGSRSKSPRDRPGRA